MTHNQRTWRMLAETWTVFASLTVAAVALAAGTSSLHTWGLALVVGAQGAWLMRHYVAAHEATHLVLFRDRRWLNDLAGQLLVLPLLLPLRVYRKIHRFHHGHNRRDYATAALDTYVVDGPVRPRHKALYGGLWFVAVFGGGFYFHGVVSVLLFLALPLRVATKVSPAFKGWSAADRWSSIGVLAAGVGLHVGVYLLWGPRLYLAVLGLPVLVFAWVYSVIVYIYHYGTTYGSGVRFHARSLRHHAFFSWWLIHFNHHATHHRDPRLAWYELPDNARPLPDAHAANGDVDTVLGAIANLLNGPKIVTRAELDALRSEGA